MPKWKVTIKFKQTNNDLTVVLPNLEAALRLIDGVVRSLNADEIKIVEITPCEASHPQ